MRRRDFIAHIGTAILCWPRAALAQSSATRFIGLLSSGSPNERAHLVEAFRRGLREGGYVDGKDVAIEYRWAEGRYDRHRDLVEELVKRNVAVIVVAGSAYGILAAKSATSTIPIVFTSGVDPVKSGIVASLGRPGGNVTGVTNVGASLEAKRFQLFREMVPTAATVAYLWNPKSAAGADYRNDVESAARTTVTKLRVLNASNETEIDAAFAGLKKSHASAMFIALDAFFTGRREQIVQLAAKYRIPACYSFREFAMVGGLMSYGADLAAAWYQTGLQTARVLKGEKPGDLPVIQSAKFEFVVNLKTARALRLAIPKDLLSRADAVIE